MFITKKLWILILLLTAFLIAGCAAQKDLPEENLSSQEHSAGDNDEKKPGLVIFTVNPDFSPEDFRNDIFRVYTDSSGLERLTVCGRIGEAWLSPYGEQILYAEHYDAAAFKYYLMDSNGSNSRLLTPEPVASMVDWAPESGLFLYDGYDRERGEWFYRLVDTHSFAAKELLSPHNGPGYQALTPDGSEVWVLMHDLDKGWTMQALSLGQGQWSEVAFGCDLPLDPWLIGFSPSGRYLLLGSWEENEQFLTVLEREKGKPVIRQAWSYEGGAVHVWSVDDRLAYLTPAGITVASPGQEEPQIFWLREGINDLIGWEGEEIIFSVRTPQSFLLAKTDGQVETELVHLTDD